MNATFRSPGAGRWIALAAATLLLALAFSIDRRQAFLAYLVAWLFVLGTCVGAMVMRMVHALTGGRWGQLVRPALVTLTAAIPWASLLVVPLLLGVHHLFPWSHADVVAASALLQEKSAYLNVPFFMLRTVVALTLWSLLARRIVALDAPQVEMSEAMRARLKSTSIAGLIIYAFSITWFGVDWVMSLVPEWTSTGFGLLLALGQTLAGFAAALAATAWSLRGAISNAEREALIDLGNIALTLVMLWAYLAFMQYLVDWIGDQPREIAWYVPRLQTSWKNLGIVIVIAHFAIPFLVLLFRSAKRSARIVWMLGVWLLLAHWLDVVWLVAPAIRRAGFMLHWPDFVAAAALLGLLFAYVARRRSSREMQRGGVKWQEARTHG